MICINQNEYTKNRILPGKLSVPLVNRTEHTVKNTKLKVSQFLSHPERAGRQQARFHGLYTLLCHLFAFQFTFFYKISSDLKSQPVAVLFFHVEHSWALWTLEGRRHRRSKQRQRYAPLGEALQRMTTRLILRTIVYLPRVYCHWSQGRAGSTSLFPKCESNASYCLDQ